MPRSSRRLAAQGTAAAAVVLASLLGLPAPAAADDGEPPPLSIYGFARLDVLVNDSRMSSLDDPSFVLREPDGGQLDSELTMTPRLSRIGLAIERWDLGGGGGGLSGDGKLEIDFAGGDGANALRLRHAYGAITNRRETLSLLAGQTWDLMSPLFPSAQNDGQLRYAGNLGDRRAQLRLTAAPMGFVQVAIAGAAPAVLDPRDLDGDGQDDAMASARPMLQWLVEVKRHLGRGPGPARLGVSGHVARTELADGTRRTAASIAAHLYLPLHRALVLLGELHAGTALAELGGGLAQGASPATGELVRARGGWLELALLPSQRHMLAVGSSLDAARSEDLATGDRARNGTVYAVLRYKPRPALQLGLEHLYWRTEYLRMGSGVANRVNAHLSVFF